MSLPSPFTTARVPSETSFAELFLALGPHQIGDTADNTYAALYGRPYALVLDVDRVLRLYRGEPAGGGYVEVTDGLPDILFGPTLPATARRFTAAFDQSARIIVAYEDEGVIYVTRWTGSEYVQNVSFDGVDPCLIMDATLADPRGYPRAEDGWSVYEAYLAGITVLFEWLASDPVLWLENAIPDSDILLFCLTPDRLGVRARVQRQLYGIPQVVHDFAQPVIMDRVIALPGRYQALVSDAATGDPLEQMIVSDPYLGDYIIAPDPTDAVAMTVAVVDARYANTVLAYSAAEALDVAVAVQDARYKGSTAIRAESERVEVGVVVLDARYASTISLRVESEEAVVAVAVQDARYRELVAAQDEGEGITVAVVVQDAKYKEA